MIFHVAIQAADLAASLAFYDQALAPLGGKRLADTGSAVGYGTDRAEFWVGEQQTGLGFRETHFAFVAPDRDAVRAFFNAAVGAGAEVLNEPRVFAEYHPNYYAAFVRDPDGNNVEAVCNEPE